MGKSGIGASVVRDGDLAGYRWGIERKRALLAAEQEAVATEAAAE